MAGLAFHSHPAAWNGYLKAHIKLLADPSVFDTFSFCGSFSNQAVDNIGRFMKVLNSLFRLASSLIPIQDFFSLVFSTTVELANAKIFITLFVTIIW